MNKFIEKLISKMEKISESIRPVGWSRKIEVVETKAVIEIINQLAEEYKTSFINGLVEVRKNCSEDSDCSECPFGQIEARCILAELRIDTDIKKNDGWIPCSERYPETNDYILLSFENFPIPLVGRYEEDVNGGAFYIGDEDETCVSQDIFVNAWKALPAPYQSKGIALL